VFPLGTARCDDARRYRLEMKSDLHAVTAPERIFTSGWSKMKKKPGQVSKSSLRFSSQVDSKDHGLATGKAPHRHGQLRRRLGDVSQRMLTRTLRNLESTGLIARQVTKSKSIAVGYSLTQLGRTFVAPLTGIGRWANQHHKELSAIVHLLETNVKQT
jgi:DNA-binding HxlR family transcriptional regulator